LSSDPEQRVKVRFPSSALVFRCSDKGFGWSVKSRVVV
jgi:hypothetical protein